MLLGLIFTNPLVFFIIAIALVISITIHEFAHAWMADRLGDPTPRYQGRVTLDPRSHLDPIGTIAILLVGFGWGRAVMFDPYNLKDPVKDTAKIALAGPASNLILALVLAFLVAILPTAGLALAIEFIIYINVMLAIFNLIPIHPLDGGKIAVALLPEDMAIDYDRFMSQYGMLVLIALIIPWAGGQSPAAALILPVINFLVSIILAVPATVMGL